MNRSSRQKINKKISALNETLEQMDLTGIYRTFHLTAAHKMFFFKCIGEIHPDRSYSGPKQTLTNWKKLK